MNTVRQTWRHVVPIYNKNRIIISGWVSSGSTFLYQVAKRIGIKEVKKTHSCRRKGYHDFTLYPYRDPRDVILSHAKRRFSDVWKNRGSDVALAESYASFMESGCIQRLERNITQPNVVLIRYERSIIENQAATIHFIAENMGMPLTDDNCLEILNECSLNANIKRCENMSTFSEYDNDSQLHGGHISNKGKVGGWREVFSDSFADKVHGELAPFLDRWGYGSN